MEQTKSCLVFSLLHRWTKSKILNAEFKLSVMDFETERRQIVKDVYFSSDEDYYRHSNQKLLMLINYSSSERTIHPFWPWTVWESQQSRCRTRTRTRTRDHDQNSTVTWERVRRGGTLVQQEAPPPPNTSHLRHIDSRARLVESSSVLISIYS